MKYARKVFVQICHREFLPENLQCNLVFKNVVWRMEKNHIRNNHSVRLRVQFTGVLSLSNIFNFFLIFFLFKTCTNYFRLTTKICKFWKCFHFFHPIFSFHLLIIYILRFLFVELIPWFLYLKWWNYILINFGIKNNSKITQILILKDISRYLGENLIP